MVLTSVIISLRENIGLFSWLVVKDVWSWTPLTMAD